MEKESSSMLQRLFSFSLGPLLSAPLILLIVPVTTWLISPAEYGKATMYLLVFHILSKISLLGMDQAFIRHFFESKNKCSLFYTSICLPLIFSFILGLFSFFLYPDISILLFGKATILPLICLLISLPLEISSTFMILVFRMEEKAKFYSFIMILFSFFRLLLITSYLILLRDFTAIIYGETSTLLIMNLILILKSKNSLSSSHSFNTDLLKKLLIYGTPFVPAEMLNLLFNSMDRFALRTWATYVELGTYSVALKISGGLLIVYIAFRTFWLPTAYKWHETNHSLADFERVGKYLCSFMTAIVIVIILSRPLLVRIIGPDFRDVKILIPFVALFPFFMTLSAINEPGINFMNKTYFHMIISVTGCLANFIGNALLVPRYGSLGASISTCLSFFLLFTLRTIISRCLWKPFRISFYFSNSFLLLLLSSITLLDGKKAYALWIEWGLSLLIIMFNRSTILSGLCILNQFFKSRAKDKNSLPEKKTV